MEEDAPADLVPEAAVYDGHTGKEVNKDSVRKGRETEMEEIQRHGVYEEVKLCYARGRTVRAPWVEDERKKDGGEPFVRSRLVAMEFNTYSREDVNAGTPPIACVHAVVSLAATQGGRRHLGVHDVQVPFLLSL